MHRPTAWRPACGVRKNPAGYARGVWIVGKKLKSTRINEEFARLKAKYQTLPENQMAIVEPLLQNAAFMKVTLDDLQVIINDEGCSEEYMNGANQYGKKASASLQSYNSLIKNYNTVSERLSKLLPPDKQESLLERMRHE